LTKHIKGEQVFRCPLIDVSEAETLASVSSAKKECVRIKKVFPSRNVKLLHGKTPKDERSHILQDMRKGIVDILVATPVIEVGIDIPNASIMGLKVLTIGLAQLQLRGRGTRGQKSILFPFHQKELAQLID
jgi:ATP-dependent DNA helicase RecG